VFNPKLKMIFRIILYLGWISLIGCATDGVHDFRSLMVAQHLVTEPTKENNFLGLLTETTQSSPYALERRANEICSTRGGVFASPSFSHNHEFYGWKIYRYQCNGFTKTDSKLHISQDQPQKETLKHEKEIVAPHITTQPRNEELAEPQSKEKTEFQKQINSLSIDEAKLECRRLGFKEKSEKFGDCVLRLSK
jgi:hypothetical protein